MFAKLFAENGLSLDRLRTLLEVGSAGSIVKASGGDPVRQSQYSRQIKELEEYFRTRLIERHGKGSRLTSNGRELARISRFFMLGLSNFQRGCLAEKQSFRIGSSATFICRFLLPALSLSSRIGRTTYATEAATDHEIERRLHDLTLDFGVVCAPALSRPLQLKELGEWRLQLWAPKSLRLNQAKAALAFRERNLPLALARKELESLGALSPSELFADLVCDSFLEVLTAIETGRFTGLLPAFLARGLSPKLFFRIHVPEIDSLVFRYFLAWNPRSLRLNPRAARGRDWLAENCKVV
jgi:DNA-binding transcriptional LysR family regulator